MCSGIPLLTSRPVGHVEKEAYIVSAPVEQGVGELKKRLGNFVRDRSLRHRFVTAIKLDFRQAKFTRLEMAPDADTDRVVGPVLLKLHKQVRRRTVLSFRERFHRGDVTRIRHRQTAGGSPVLMGCYANTKALIAHNFQIREKTYRLR